VLSLEEDETEKAELIESEFVWKSIIASVLIIFSAYILAMYLACTLFVWNDESFEYKLFRLTQSATTAQFLGSVGWFLLCFVVPLAMIVLSARYVWILKPRFFKWMLHLIVCLMIAGLFLIPSGIFMKPG
jgi:hypothetical protein